MRHWTGVVAAGLALALHGQALAQWNGIAVAQAPEAALGMCFGEDPHQAISCAQDMCMRETGFGPEDCPVTNWCFPAYWSADVFMQHREGLHWHEILCGWQNRDDLEAAIAIKCAAEWLIECTPVALWNPDGDELTP